MRYPLDLGSGGSEADSPPAATIVFAIVESCSMCPDRYPPATSARRKGQGLFDEPRAPTPARAIEWGEDQRSSRRPQVLTLTLSKVGLKVWNGCSRRLFRLSMSADN